MLSVLVFAGTGLSEASLSTHTDHGQVVFDLFPSGKIRYISTSSEKGSHRPSCSLQYTYKAQPAWKWTLDLLSQNIWISLSHGQAESGSNVLNGSTLSQNESKPLLQFDKNNFLVPTPNLIAAVKELQL